MPVVDRFLRSAMSLPGARGASVIDFANGLALGVAGDLSRRDADALVADATDVLRAVAYEARLAAPTGPDTLDDVIIVAGGSYHILRFMDSGLGVNSFCHCWFDQREANLALARLKLRETVAAVTPS